ncbi:MAG TPA: septum formation initiator family protein [Blastocatellia bacterium]|nr:septum formation initiator family protein [Blastocatellia bacterium]
MGQVANTFWVDEASAAPATTRLRALARRRSRVRRMIDALVCAVILAATGLCVSVYYRAHGELAGAMLRHQSAADRVAELKRVNERLAREVEQLKSDPRMIEAMARERLGFVRPGDVVIRIGEEADESSAAIVKIGASDNVRASLTPRIGDRYTQASN